MDTSQNTAHLYFVWVIVLGFLISVFLVLNHSSFLGWIWNISTDLQNPWKDVLVKFKNWERGVLEY